MFDGRLPAALADGAPQVVETDDGRQVWLYEGREYPNIGLNAVIGRPKRRVEHGARPLRRDAPRLLGHRRPHRRHGPRRRLRVAVLPVADRRVRGHGLLEERGPGARARRAAGLERLAPRGVGRHATRTASSRCSSPWLDDPELAADEIRRNAERGFKAVSFPEKPAQSRPAVDAHRRTGIRSSPRARRPTPSCACTPARRRGRRSPSPDAPLETITTLFPVNALVAARRLAVVAASRCGSRSSTSRSPRAASAGWPMLIDRIDYVLDALRVGSRGRVVEERPAAERGAAAQLLVLLDRRPVTRSALLRRDRRRPHPASRATTRTPTRPGPTPSRSSRAALARPVGRGRRPGSPTSNAAQLFRHPLPDERGWLSHERRRPACSTC